MRMDALGGLKGRPEQADKGSGRTATELEAACRSFEAFFIAQMLDVMREAGESDRGLLPTSRAEKIFLAQQNEALAEVLADREPLGVARMLREALEAGQVLKDPGRAAAKQAQC